MKPEKSPKLSNNSLDFLNYPQDLPMTQAMPSPINAGNAPDKKRIFSNERVSSPKD
jgi:hypothetical protein